MRQRLNVQYKSMECQASVFTKLDVMDGMEEIKICVGYIRDGKEYDILPFGSRFSS